MQAVHDLGVGEVLDRALARDIDGLLKSIPWEQIACDDPLMIRNACEITGVRTGTSVQAIHLEDSSRYFDRAYVRDFFDALVGDPEATLVFAARAGERVGISFAIPTSKPRPVGGGSPLKGIWFDLRRGSPPLISGIAFFTEFSGPRQFFQAFYQPEGGEVLYFDAQNSPGVAPVPTPDAPKVQP